MCSVCVFIIVHPNIEYQRLLLSSEADDLPDFAVTDIDQ